jgi:hypothetical protein
MVQTAANTVNLDAALKLVEAGCKWQLPKGQRVQDGYVNYAPEILSIESPNLKVRLRHVCSSGCTLRVLDTSKQQVTASSRSHCSLGYSGIVPNCGLLLVLAMSRCAVPCCAVQLAYVEGRFRLAEKMGRQKRAAIATALQPWLSPDITPECKEATLRCLVAAGVTPGNTNTRQRLLLTSAPSPRVKAQWAGVQAQRAAAAAGSSTGQQDAGARQVSTAVDDIDALLEEIESVGGKELNAGGAAATAAAAGSKAGSKKKKKETAAQREARKKEQQRVQQLQAGGSGSDSDREGEVRGSREAAGSSPAASSAADTQAGSGAAGPGEQRTEQEATVAPSDMPSLTQQQATQNQQQQAVQKQDNSQVGRAARKQQQQARASSSEAAAAAPAGEGGVPGPAMQPARQQRTPAPPQLATEVPAVPAAAVLHMPPQASRAARKTATTGDAQQQVASLQQAGTEQQPQQQRVKVAPQGAPVAPPAAPVAVPAAAPQANPSAVAMRPAAFLPPHLRISMPAAPAAGVAPAAGGAGAAVPPPPVLPMPHPAAMQPPPQLSAQQQVPMQEQPQGSAMQQRMVELAKQHQLQQQAAAQTGASAPQQQQHPQPSSSTGSQVPAVPHAMMDLLQSGSAQHTTKAAAGRKGHAAAGGTTGARAAQQRPGAKRQPPAAAAAQQNGHSPAAAGKPAAGRPTNSAGSAAGDAGGGSKGPKLCLVCAQRRRNVLLIPCRHLVLCAECAEQLHGQGQLSSCPHCKKPCKQHIRVHQS